MPVRYPLGRRELEDARRDIVVAPHDTGHGQYPPPHARDRLAGVLEIDLALHAEHQARARVDPEAHRTIGSGEDGMRRLVHRRNHMAVDLHAIDDDSLIPRQFRFQHAPADGAEQKRPVAARHGQLGQKHARKLIGRGRRMPEIPPVRRKEALQLGAIRDHDAAQASWLLDANPAGRRIVEFQPRLGALAPSFFLGLANGKRFALKALDSP